MSGGVTSALEAVRAHTGFEPEVGLILGSGLGGLAREVEPVLDLPYEHLPGFPRATTPGHPGRLVLGALAGRRVCAFLGRFHRYEGHATRDVAAPVRLLEALGGGTLLVTNAAGIVNPRLWPGTPMLLADRKSVV